MSNKNSLWALRTRSTTHHLLGSVHYLREEYHPFDQAIEKACDAAEVVVFEMDLGGFSEGERNEMFRATGHYQDGQTLAGNLPRDTYELVKRRAAQLGMDLGVVNTMKPWFLWLLINLIASGRSGCDAEYGVEKYLMRKLNMPPKEVIYLEGFQDQLNFLDGIPPGAQEVALAHSLEIFDEIPARFEAIGRAWATGDLKKLEALTLELAAEHPEVNEALITVRNQNWLPKIEGYIYSDRSHLIVVGVGHLVGEQGIIHMLESKGYPIEQL